jgi:hypothetical protein
MKNGGVGTIIDHTVWLILVEPPLGMVLEKPLRNEDGKVRHLIGFLKQSIHFASILPFIALIDTMEAKGSRIHLFVGLDFFWSELYKPAKSRVN